MVNNKQSAANKSSKITWFQNWMLKSTRVFGLDAVQGSNETRASRIQKYGEQATQADDAVMRQEGWRSFSFAGSRPARPKGSGGDTIVEVILATALIAAATGLAYSMSNHNLSNGVSAGQRSQALSLAGAQIERIKNAYLTNSPLLASYKIDKPFCILSDGSEEDVSRSGSKCANFGGNPYSVAVNYNKTTLVFTTDVSWSSNSNNSGQDQLTLYYKLPG